MNQNLRFAALLLLVAVVAGTSGFYLRWWMTSQTKEDRPHNINQTIGDTAPNFKLPDLDGTLQSLEQWRGSLVLLNFWASWCAPCRKEIPALVELHKSYHTKGLRVVGIALDEITAARSFVNEYGMNYPILVADPATGMVLMESFANRSGSIPYTVVIDGQGEIVSQHWQALDFKQAEELVLPLLPAPH
ncbi:MAG: TlpA family protein disulfide reductase [Candidatus Porifericomitaceae bacterium WSBS_2022_MAG_OTU9]